MQSYWPKSQDICIAALPCISTPKTFWFMGKANFLPAKSRRKNKTSNFLHQHFLLDKFTTFCIHYLYNISMGRLQLRKPSYAKWVLHHTTKGYIILEQRRVSTAPHGSINKKLENIPISHARLWHGHKHIFWLIINPILQTEKLRW